VDGVVPVETALLRRRSVRSYRRTAMSMAEVSQLLWAAQGITDDQGMRTAPSAGALYPLETYLVAGRVAELEQGIYRYGPRRHELRLRVDGDRRARLATASYQQDWVKDAAAIVLISAVRRRMASRYPDRGERYILMEVGHVAQNIHLQAEALGLGTVVVGAFDDDEVKAVAELGPGEAAQCLMPVGRLRRGGSRRS
jgi:SagB-type dehydrogenase family enzyme